MVEFQCPYCRKRFPDDELANDCADECALDRREEIIVILSCKYCNKVNRNKQGIEICEQNHEEKQDIHFINYNAKINHERLMKAGFDKNQLKVINF